MKYIKNFLFVLVLGSVLLITGCAEDVGDFGSDWSTNSQAGHDALSGKYAAAMTIYVEEYEVDMTSEFNPQTAFYDIWLDDNSTPSQVSDELNEGWGINVAVIDVDAETELHESDILYTVDPFDSTRYTYLTLSSTTSGWDQDAESFVGQYYHPKNGKLWVGDLPNWVGSKAIIVLDN